MTLYTDDDVQRGVSDLGLHRCADEWVVRAILDAVLPAYRKRLLSELADRWSDDDRPIYTAYMVRAWLTAMSQEETTDDSR